MSTTAPATTIATTLSEALGLTLERARAFGAREAGRSPIFAQNLRRDGLEALGKLGLPGPSDEEWRYTSVATLARRLPATVLAAAVPGAGNLAARAALAALGPLGVAGRNHHQLPGSRSTRSRASRPLRPSSSRSGSASCAVTSRTPSSR